MKMPNQASFLRRDAMAFPRFFDGTLRAMARARLSCGRQRARGRATNALRQRVTVLFVQALWH